MIANRRILLCVSVAAFTIVSVAGCNPLSQSSGGSPNIEGQYTLVSDLTKQSQETVQIEEFIAFSCSHCYDYNQSFAELYDTLGPKVHVETVPFSRPGDPVSDLRLYFVAEQAGLGPQAKEKLYQAFQGTNAKELRPEQLTAIAGDLGVLEQYQSTKDDPAIDARIDAARERARTYGVPGVPMLVVEGQLRTHADKENVTGIIDQLLAPQSS